MKGKLLIESGGVLHKPALQESETKGKWTASIWKLDQKNLNGRIYSTELAKKICAENKVTVAYDGHDVNWATGEEYGISKAVCLNPRIEGEELRVDIKFVDKDYEALLTFLAEEGVAIGVSSVGYGETDDYGRIKEDTYELVRYLDFVTMPAGEVYAKMGEKAGGRHPGQSEESMDESDADEALAERRSKVAQAFADLLIRR